MNQNRSNSAVGKFLDEFKSEAKQTASDTAQTLGSEPKKILEGILGKASTDDKGANEQGIEPISQANSSDDPAAQQLLVKKQIEEKQRSAKLIQLHRQKLEEEKNYFMKRQQEEEVLKKQQEQQEEEQKQHQVMQLKRRGKNRSSCKLKHMESSGRMNKTDIKDSRENLAKT